MPAIAPSVSAPVRHFSLRSGIAWLGDWMLLLVAWLSGWGLMVGYLATMACLGAVWGWLGLRSIERSETLADGMMTCLLWVMGGLTWVQMVVPLIRERKRNQMAILISNASQPRVMGLVHRAIEAAGAKKAPQVWLEMDVGERGVQCTKRGHQLELRIALPVLAGLSERGLAVLLSASCGKSGLGLKGYLEKRVRLSSKWFEAGRGLEDWQDGGSKNLGRTILSGWRMLSELAFVGCERVYRWVAGEYLKRSRSRWVERVEELAGREEAALVLRRLRHLESAWRTKRQQLKKSDKSSGLPELPLEVVRLATWLERNDGVDGVTWEVEGTAVLPQALALDDAVSPAWDLLREGQAISRELTRGWEINRSEGSVEARMEMGIGYRGEWDGNEPLADLQRYFQGLAHPERAVFGLARTHRLEPGAEVLRAEIIRVRQELLPLGEPMRQALKEWQDCWKRRRDLLAEGALRQAGVPVLGAVVGGCAGDIWEKAEEQRQMMDLLDEAMATVEVEMESRFAAALGLLWWADERTLGGMMLQRQKELPQRVALFEAMASVLPIFREMATRFHSVQILSSRIALATDGGALLATLQGINSQMLEFARQFRDTLDGAWYWRHSGAPAVKLTEHLFGCDWDSFEASLTRQWRTGGIEGMGRELARVMMLCIDPLLRRYLQLYHETYGWLAATAERAETVLGNSSESTKERFEPSGEGLLIGRCGVAAERQEGSSPSRRSYCR